MVRGRKEEGRETKVIARKCQRTEGLGRSEEVLDKEEVEEEEVQMAGRVDRRRTTSARWGERRRGRGTIV